MSNMCIDLVDSIKIEKRLQKWWQLIIDTVTNLRLSLMLYRLHPLKISEP
jgi:hypothetical protein